MKQTLMKTALGVALACGAVFGGVSAAQAATDWGIMGPFSTKAQCENERVTWNHNGYDTTVCKWNNNGYIFEYYSRW